MVSLWFSLRILSHYIYKLVAAISYVSPHVRADAMSWKPFPYYWSLVRKSSDNHSNVERWYFLFGIMDNILNKQSNCRWKETSCRSCDVTVMVASFYRQGLQGHHVAVCRWNLQSPWNHSGTVRSRQVSKSRDSGLDFSNRPKIWQAFRQRCCRDARQISVRYDHHNVQSRGFETSRDLVVRRLTPQCIEYG